jgi:hypothetical protein
MIVRCRICKEVSLSTGPVLVGRQEEQFMQMVGGCTRHVAERHPEVFAQVSSVAGQAIAALSLELFESQDPTAGDRAAAMRAVAVTALRDSRFSEVSGGFELRPPVTSSETDLPN